MDGDWADDKAREFCNERWPSQRVEADDLAALLRSTRREALDMAARLCVIRSVSWSREDNERSDDYREGIEHAASQLAQRLRS